MSVPENAALSANFIQNIIAEDNRTGKYGRRVHTRFPPEPNGYLHIGHAKSICLNFGIAAENQGLCNLRFDDTNPSKEDVEYVDSIQEDVRWLGFHWDDRMYYASDYFEQLYQCAERLVELGKAYVCDLTAIEMRDYRGTLKDVGRNSPFRDRSVAENMDLFRRMRAGEFPDGARTLRAKIDMGSPNLNMRDPVLYRILRATHHRTGDVWCIYPMYDYAHPISDSIEEITHSICTLEFEDHRPLYDWVLIELGAFRPQQIEFARLNLTHTVMSKRKLRELVEQKLVDGWNDSRMPTISGLRRRGYTPEAIRDFCERIGVAKSNSIVDIEMLEHCIREDLNAKAPRVMGVLRPLKIVITNYPENRTEEIEAENNPENPEMGSRRLPFSRELYIDQEDFMEEPPKNFFRLGPGREVRLKHAYIIRCESVVKDPTDGRVVELSCTYDPETKSGGAASGKKVKGTLHWVSAAHACPAEVRLYDHLFAVDKSADVQNEEEQVSLNPDSLITLTDVMVEPGIASATIGSRFQFLRQGYFCVDTDSSPGKLVFNRIVPLRDTWAKVKNS